MFALLKFAFLLVTTLFGAFVLVPTLLVGSLFALAVVGDPGECGGSGRVVYVTPGLADSFQAKWSALSAQAALGQPASASFTEHEMTSRAVRFLEESGDDDFVQDLKICLRDGYIEASGKVSPPIGPDVRAKLQGMVSIDSGYPAHPVAQIERLRVGKLPGGLSGLAEGPINDFIVDQLSQISVFGPVDVVVTDGQMTVTSRPPAIGQPPR